MDISTECGINASMLSQWMQGRYKGNIRRLNRMMEYWMEQRRAGKEVVPMSRAEAVREVAQDASHLYQTPGTKAQTSNKRQREDPQSALQASGALAETFDYPYVSVVVTCISISLFPFKNHIERCKRVESYTSTQKYVTVVATEAPTLMYCYHRKCR